MYVEKYLSLASTSDFLTDLDPIMPREDRLAKLKSHWGFDCNCSRCTQARIFTDASDKRLELIQQITEELQLRSANRTSRREGSQLLISLYEQERLNAPIAEAYTYAALEESYVGNRDGVIKYAALAVEAGLLYGGPKDGDVNQMQAVLEHPEEHWSWLHMVKIGSATKYGPSS